MTAASQDLNRHSTPWPGRWALLVAGVTVVSAIAPPHPWEQFLQHLATPLVLAALWVGGRRGWVSGPAAAGVAVFFLLHAIAARFLYSTVPGGERLTLFSLGGPEGRNHFDRLVHFASGLLLAPVVAELAARFGGMKTAWACGFGVCLLLAIAAVYEVFEWSLTALLDPAFADRYNGLQGDEWDAQKDMFLAGLGALLALPISWRLARTAARESGWGRLPVLTRFTPVPAALRVPQRRFLSVLALTVGLAGAGTYTLQADEEASPPPPTVPPTPIEGETVFVQTESESYYLSGVALVPLGDSFLLTGRTDPNNDIVRAHFGAVTVRIPWDRVVSMQGFDSPELRAKASRRRRSAPDIQEATEEISEDVEDAAELDEDAQ